MGTSDTVFPYKPKVEGSIPSGSIFILREKKDMRGLLRNGLLFIERVKLVNDKSEGVGTSQSQMCPYSSNKKQCDTHCPLFGDIVFGNLLSSVSNQIYENGAEIHICNNKILTFSEFSIDQY